MARQNKDIQPLFPLAQKPKEEKEEEQKSEAQPVEKEIKEPDPESQAEEKEKSRQSEPGSPDDGDKKEASAQVNLQKYKKRPKYETHVAHNTRIPRELRREMEKIGKKLGVPLNKNSGFFQEFTIDALWAAVEKAKRELGID